ncbi:MAG TPA: restriction endonuclease subunit M, partial [Paenibacillaceae bacterium]|nr:restriction endonuclease subunit M [Paenibacillaceae bacterium]
IIFLRMCEDRGIEKYGQLRSLIDKKEIYQKFGDICKEADAKYNSGLFHFKEEKGRPSTPDELTLDLSIDDGVFKTILKSLYYPESPYEFSVLQPEILGNVYEQFLGKVIRLTASHRAKVEEKAEVKKAGGVYYTPQYIVDYMVEKTVGKLCQGKTPNKVSKLKILDPACGSGSFLLGAYKYLLQWHRDYYSEQNDKKRLKDKIYQGKNGEWFLTIQEKKRILLNNIYGVDIDSQAVWVTKLSLLLKVLEGENRDALEAQQKLFKERALPDLDSNIKCGNTLIGPDIYNDSNLDLTANDIKRINPFEWEKEFQKIMKDGGFDVIIGNPPYVDIKGLPEIDVTYIFEMYGTSNNRINLFATFIERSFSLLKSEFHFSMIIPTAILTQSSYKDLRKMVMANYAIDTIVRLPNESFGSAAGDVKVDTLIIVLKEKSRSKKIEVIAYSGYDRINKIDPMTASIDGVINQDIWLEKEDYVWTINISETEEKILAKCEKNSLKLEDIVEFSLGITPYDKYKGHKKEQIANKVFHSDFKKDNTFKKLLEGKDVKRYSVEWNGKRWISYGPWLGAPRKQEFFTEKRILVKQIIDWSSKRIWATITDDELYNTQNAFNLLLKSDLKLEYILGILNSRLITFYHRKRYLDEFKMRFQKILIKDCRRFPIHTINFANPKDVSLHDRTVNLVEQMLQLHKDKESARTPQDKELIKRQIEATDKQIDSLVYELYDLTDKEIKIVEDNI